MKISIIGAGNMGGATAHGLLKSNTCQAKELCISDPSSQKLQPFDCI
ncbi:MAG TPA: pyrroline-5-carboxylate reductase, partial [Prevotellaceae bacterium]|nr:pyrroline-5-carboxylate reductase [Prevotellaceae bacterium]